MADPTARRTWFGPVLLAGLATAALTAVAAGKAWFHVSGGGALPGMRTADRAADMPLALALALVVLAGWGVVLVTRGRVRRAMAGLALLAALGVVACVVAAPFSLPDQIRENVPGGSSGTSVSPTGWYVTTAVAAVLATLALILAWRLAPLWPTMSSRYDAPASRPAGTDDTDLWKALDAGHDPTDPNRRTGPPSP
jgi:uncharacterized membrane protein (TIGR02234 family)